MNVRPVFRRLAIVAFVILLPLVAYSAWDYIEVRRLVHEIEAIRAKGEPVSERDVPGNWHQLTEARDAASYYMAGGMLALGTHPYTVTTPIREWLAEPAPDRQSLPKLAVPLQQFVEGAHDALALADQAARLPFNGFPGGTSSFARRAWLSSLRLVSARTLSLSGRVTRCRRRLGDPRPRFGGRFARRVGSPFAGIRCPPCSACRSRRRKRWRGSGRPGSGGQTERALENLLWSARAMSRRSGVVLRLDPPCRAATAADAQHHGNKHRPWFSHKTVVVLRRGPNCPTCGFPGPKRRRPAPKP